METSFDQPQRPCILTTILGRLAILLALAMAGIGAMVWSGIIVVPGHLNPFTPLRIEDQVGFLTGMKLSRLEGDGPQCLAVLGDSSVVHRAVPSRPASEGCGLSNGVDVTRSGIVFNRGFTATCPVAVSWAMLETHVLRPAAQEYFGQDIARVTHLGTYACRNINGHDRGRRSEHATANAIDISGFTLADGRRISVESDWAGRDPRKADFLKAVRDGACRFFDVVLSPAYNKAHHDHFHFDMGSYRACR
jgi:hypothetical protein